MHGGSRRRYSRSCVLVQNLPTHQTTYSLYMAFRVYGPIVKISRPDTSTAVIAFRLDRDATEMKRWEDQVQVDGLPLIVVPAESSMDDTIQADVNAVPGPGQWKCWLCLAINQESEETCTGLTCEVARGLPQACYDASLSIDLGVRETPGLISKHRRRTVIATEIPRDTKKAVIQYVFSRYGEITGLWVYPNANGTEAQVTFAEEESADKAVEYEHSKQLDSQQPIIVWKATSAFVIELQPLTHRWMNDSLTVAEKEKWIEEAYQEKYGAITGVYVRPDVAYVEFPSFTSVLEFLSGEKDANVCSEPCHTALSCKYSKWPCLSCAFIHNDPKQKQCANCQAIKPNFKVVNLPVVWPQQLELFKAQAAAANAAQQGPPSQGGSGGSHHKDHHNDRRQNQSHSHNHNHNHAQGGPHSDRHHGHNMRQMPLNPPSISPVEPAHIEPVVVPEPVQQQQQQQPPPPLTTVGPPAQQEPLLVNSQMAPIGGAPLLPAGATGRGSSGPWPDSMPLSQGPPIIPAQPPAQPPTQPPVLPPASAPEPQEDPVTALASLFEDMHGLLGDPFVSKTAADTIQPSSTAPISATKSFDPWAPVKHGGCTELDDLDPVIAAPDAQLWKLGLSDPTESDDDFSLLPNVASLAIGN